MLAPSVCAGDAAAALALPFFAAAGDCLVTKPSIVCCPLLFFCAALSVGVAFTARPRLVGVAATASLVSLPLLCFFADLTGTALAAPTVGGNLRFLVAVALAGLASWSPAPLRCTFSSSLRTCVVMLMFARP
jgi:hypothetical protein